MGSRVIGSLIAVGLLCAGLIYANMNRDEDAVDIEPSTTFDADPALLALVKHGFLRFGLSGQYRSGTCGECGRRDRR